MPTAARIAKAKAKAAEAEALAAEAAAEAQTPEPTPEVEAPAPVPEYVPALLAETITNPVFALEPFRVISLTLDDDTPETVPVYGEYLHSPTGSILELEPEHAASDAMALIEDETGFRVKSIELEPVA